MRGALPDAATRILERGSFCHVAVRTGRGPHLTPTVFAFSGGHVWVTTSRGSVKARAWARDPRVAGLVRDGEMALSFTGGVQLYDLLDADTWVPAVRATPALTAASMRFTRKNARFFAGYAVDARHVPLSWTPPGRVFVRIELERGAVLDATGIRETWGSWMPRPVARERFRAARSGADPLGVLPPEVRGALGGHGTGALALDAPDGTVVLPARWAIDGPELFAALPEAVLALADGGPGWRAALAVERSSWWRARRMIGAMVQGAGEGFALERLTYGRKSADARAELTGVDPYGAALVRIRPERLVWWHGWSAGAVAVG